MAFLAMFPLNLVVFPGENLNLHIFEPRYRELVADCLLFGIPPVSKNNVRKIGTEVGLVEISKKYASGELDIKTKGKRRFRILDFYRKAPGKLYSGAEVEFLDDIDDGSSYEAGNIIGLIDELFGMMKIQKDFEHDSTLFRVFEMAHHVGFSPEQELELLKINSELERQHFMMEHLLKLIPTLKEMKRLEDRVRMNGHFKNVSGDW